MSPLSLLFSSDEETSRPLAQALHELEFEVEHCKEIFAAVERLTGRSFEVIAADWDDGVEASFLLKTSRELKCNSAAFTVAVVNHAEAASAARLIGADLVIHKPITAEQVKYAMLSCDEFLRCLRTWLPKFNTASQTRSQLVRAEGERHTAYGAISGQNDAVSLAEEVIPSPLHASRRHGWGMAMWPYQARPARGRPKTQRGRRASLLAIACGVAAFSVGYAVSDGPRIEAGSVTKLYEQALERTQDWLGKPSGSAAPTQEIAQGTGVPEAGSKMGARQRIRVSPVASHPSSGPIEQGVQGAGQPEPESSAKLLPAPAASSSIPDSLRTPVQMASVRAIATTFGPSLLSALEPVSISEDLSQKLLLQKVAPSYPEKALRAGLQGPVVLQAWIAKDGSIRELKLVRGYFVLGQAAYQAVKQWRYKPYLLNGRAVEAQTFITVDFKLP